MDPRLYDDLRSFRPKEQYPEVSNISLETTFIADTRPLNYYNLIINCDCYGLVKQNVIINTISVISMKIKKKRV